MASLGNWPAAFVATGFDLTLQANQRVNAAPGGGSEQALDMLNDRWMCSLTLPERSETDGAALEAFLASFRGQVNTVNLWHFLRPAIRGTMAGSPVLSASAAQGAASISIQTSPSVPGATVLAGDMLGVGGLLLMVKDDAVANGSGILSVNVVNRLRVALSSSAPVTRSSPTVPFRLLAHTGVRYANGIAGEVEMTLGEVI